MTLQHPDPEYNVCPECNGGQTISNPEGRPQEYLDSCENCDGTGEVLMHDLDWLPE